MHDASYYDPEAMSAKRKAEFERWHAEKVAAYYHFVLRREREAYCGSDVKILKAGCRQFRQELEESRLRSQGEICHHRGRLQPILAQETGTQEQDCFRTSSGLARVRIQPVHQNPEMAGLARTPATPPTSCSGRSHQHCPKRRRNPCSQPHGRRIRSLRSRYSATHRARIPQMSMVRVSQMLPSPPRETSHLSQRSYQARSLRGHLKKQETQLQRQRTRQHLRDRFRYLSRTIQAIIVPGTAAETLIVLWHRLRHLHDQ